MYIVDYKSGNENMYIFNVRKVQASSTPNPDTEFFSSVRAWLAEDLSQIVEGYVEFIKLKVWKLISRGVSTKKHCFKPHIAFYHNLMHL